ncbi:MAG TPA: alkaline phosphatase family protein, partial [Xanthomonadaceae bacterium]|nr:alkaline phosphatase family protein [Xanthomonadaceae bacterium]
LSYICDAFEWVCKAWVWVSHWVCVTFVWIAHWVCKGWSYLVEWFCVAWFWVMEAFCTVWSWVAKLVCIAWDNIRCALVALGEVVASMAGRRPRRRRRIRHVFVLMLENRSFDHMLGVSDIAGTDAVTGLPTRIDNLLGNPQSNPDPAGGDIAAGPRADFALSSEVGDPGHEFDDVLAQLTGATWPSGGMPGYPPIDNAGFVANFRGRGSSDPSATMRCFEPDQLPILNTLAREFAVCDRWFSSMPGPTWPNRLFVHAASSAGLDNSPGTWDTVTTTLIDGYRFDNGTIYDRLEQKCLDWLVFEGDETPQVFSLSNMNLNALQGRFRDMEDFRDSVNDPQFPASYSFIEPHYGNIMPWTPEDYTCGTSQHPLDDVTRGERLIKDVYEAVRNSPHWESSLIIVTYDENGGFFDHVVPPPTVHPGDSVTDNENVHKHFDFTQTGTRVPAVVISPWIARGTIDHLEHEHSSVLKTLSELFSLGTLTERDRSANSLTHLLSLEVPRTDAPTQLPDVAESGWRCTGDAPVDEPGSASSGLRSREQWEAERRAHQAVVRQLEAREPEPSIRGFARVALRRYLSLAPIGKRDAILERFMRIRNSYQARVFIREARDAIRLHKQEMPRRDAWRIR